MEKPRAVIIGAGFTGAATAHDLALRGFHVTVVERGELVSGTSGRTHGLLHSGGRYCVNDQESARECIEENQILRKIARQCIEPNVGYFIALDDSDEAYAPQFVEGAAACGISAEKVMGDALRSIEPELNPNVRFGYRVPDGTFEPLRLAMGFCATARQHGAAFYTNHEVQKIRLNGNQAVQSVSVLDRTSGKEVEFPCDLIINAAGAWSGRIVEHLGIKIPVRPVPGIMVTIEGRLVNNTINRLNIPGDGDIVLPQRRFVVIGTTSFEVPNVDYIPIDRDQIEEMVARGADMIPAIRTGKHRGIFMSARPLISAGVDARNLARTFKCFDHAEADGISGLITIIGGKATTCRAMAEKISDLACEKVGIRAECTTREFPLISYRRFYEAVQ